MSKENVELVRRLYAELASEGSSQDFDQRLTDGALDRFLDPSIEWLPVSDSVLAVDSYRGFEGVRRFWAELERSVGRRLGPSASGTPHCPTGARAVDDLPTLPAPRLELIPEDAGKPKAADEKRPK